MKIISYNVNGIRAAMNKNFTEWLKEENPDIVCLQELKAQTEQIDAVAFERLGYHTFWHPAVKKGYSGVALLSKQKPNHLEIGCHKTEIDNEGRVLRADFGDISFMSVYVPSGTTGGVRQEFKMEFCSFFHDYILQLRRQRPQLVISGDINICHQPIDIHDPVRNAKSSGFLPEERKWMSNFLTSGMIDSFRHLNPNTQKYSWWSQMFNSRAKNKGWRIDYHLVSEPLKDNITRADILNEVFHSDHCPILLELTIGS